MLAFFLYTVALLLLAAAVLKSARAAAAFGLPPLLAAGILVAALVYLSGLLPGVFGLFYTPVVYGCFFALCAGLLLLLRRHARQLHLCPGDLQTAPPPLTSCEVAVLALGLLGAVPLLSYFRSLPLALLDPERQLAWDAVSYHLPGFVEYWQKHTLWSLEGPYQSYSFAFELIGNFLSQPFFTHWGLIVADVFAVGLLVGAIVAVTRATVPLVTGKRSGSWVPYAVLAVGIVSSVHTDAIGDVGKNDIFVAACLVAAFRFLLELRPDPAEWRTKGRALVALVSLSVGLALAAKPSALAFVPFFGLAAPLAVMPADPKRRTVRAVVVCVTVLSISFLLGGFWLVRNLLAFGRLSPLGGAWGLSVASNLANPALYELKRESLLFALGLAAVLPGIYLLFRSRSAPEARRALLFLVSFHVVACGAFSITPHSAFHHELTVSDWKLRLGMPLFASAALIYALAAARLCHWLSASGRRSRPALAVLIVLLVVLPLPLYWKSVQSGGLPGHDRIKGLPQTQIYRWIREQPRPLRIYSAGLRPYGLYGPAWGNTVFYDLHSTTLEPLAAGQARLAAVVRQFRPDLVVVSVDPHPYSGEPRKPQVVDWMKGLPDCFVEVYRDESVSGFRVRPEAAERLKGHLRPGYKLRMSG